MKPSTNPKYTSVGVCAFKFSLALAKVPESNSPLIITTIKLALYTLFIAKKNPVVMPSDSKWILVFS